MLKLDFDKFTFSIIVFNFFMNLTLKLNLYKIMQKQYYSLIVNNDND